jgi:hypothetical protein
VPQGTPTNNTEKGASGFSGGEDADVAYERYFGAADTETPPGGGLPEPRDPHDRHRRKDGRWLADLLGVDADASTLRQAANYYHTDQHEALAMNTALWPATLGYFLESMMGPALDEWQRSVVQWYFTNYVTGRGPVPAIRIGKQPYGILPVSALGRAKWLFERGGAFPLEGLANRLPALQGLYQFLMRVRGDWSARRWRRWGRPATLTRCCSTCWACKPPRRSSTSGTPKDLPTSTITCCSCTPCWAALG